MDNEASAINDSTLNSKQCAGVINAAVSITLPWPPSALSPNSRGHWAKLAKAKARYKRDCWLATVASVGRRPAIPDGELHLELVFSQPDMRIRDRDNLISRMKAGIDGMAAALGIDDRRFTTLTARIGDPVRGGAVIAHITAAAQCED